jgi:signal transduction histidine kinase
MNLTEPSEEDFAVQPWRLAAWRSSNDPLFVVFQDGWRIGDVNPAATAAFGLPCDRLIDSPLSELLGEPITRRLQDAFRAGDPIGRGLGGVALGSAPSGRRTYELWVSVIGGPRPALFCRLTAVGQDEAESELRRLNWALAAYARSSTALIRSKGFEELVVRVCEAIVGEDDYLAAAVGLVEQGPGSPIRIVAGAGQASRYINSLKLSWSETTPEGRGPAGRSARSGEPFIMMDSLIEPVFQLWRPTAIGFGIRSSVTVPFEHGGRTAGILSVYAGRPGAFGVRELEVFSELSRELAFALEVEENRARLRAAEEARLAAEDNARESLAELARAARVLSVATFASSIAHEINQPVAAIITNTDAARRWLSKDPPNLNEARLALDRITRDADRTSEVVGRTRGMLTKNPGKREAGDINALLNEAVLITQVQQRRASIKVEVEVADGLPMVRMDAVQIQQVMINLISNAIDAMKGIANRRRTLKISSRPSAGGEVVISVADVGTGVEVDDANKIFANMFTTKPDGIGLGLSVSRAIVEAHGGRIAMAPNPPQGSIFTFTLPVMEAD